MLNTNASTLSHYYTHTYQHACAHLYQANTHTHTHIHTHPTHTLRHTNRSYRPVVKCCGNAKASDWSASDCGCCPHTRTCYRAELWPREGTCTRLTLAVCTCVAAVVVERSQGGQRDTEVTSCDRALIQSDYYLI